VLLIKGKAGSGKTRLANQIAKEMVNNYNHTHDIDSNDEKNFEYKWELDTEIDLKVGDCICPQSVEVDFETKTITINF
jgi:CO dehydrogenase nickel-insertion accessory protein CooC1